jgi:hypothetical protein
MYLFDIHNLPTVAQPASFWCAGPQLSSKTGARQRTLVVPWLDSGAGLELVHDKFAK